MSRRTRALATVLRHERSAAKSRRRVATDLALAVAYRGLEMDVEVALRVRGAGVFGDVTDAQMLIVALAAVDLRAAAGLAMDGLDRETRAGDLRPLPVELETPWREARSWSAGTDALPDAAMFLERGSIHHGRLIHVVRRCVLHNSFHRRVDLETFAPPAAVTRAKLRDVLRARWTP